MSEEEKPKRIMTADKAGINMAIPKTKQIMEAYSKQTISTLAAIKTAAFTEFMTQYILQQVIADLSQTNSNIRIKNADIAKKCNMEYLKQMSLLPHHQQPNKKRKKKELTSNE